jgi:hyperosmotically inducible periplasmic protein
VLKKLFSSGAAVALLVPMLVAGCQTDRTADTERDYASQVNDNLRQNNLDDVRADWHEDERQLRLSGEVPTADQRARAEQLAEQVVGTAGMIVNEVRVEGVDTQAMDNHIEEQLEHMFEDRDTWAPLNFTGEGVSFDAEARVVTITGTVESQAVKDRIEQQARQVEGVREVVNNLEVDPDRRTDTTPNR